MVIDEISSQSFQFAPKHYLIIWTIESAADFLKLVTTNFHLILIILKFWKYFWNKAHFRQKIYFTKNNSFLNKSWMECSMICQDILFELSRWFEELNWSEMFYIICGLKRGRLWIVWCENIGSKFLKHQSLLWFFKNFALILKCENICLIWLQTRPSQEDHNIFQNTRKLCSSQVTPIQEIKIYMIYERKMSRIYAAELYLN